MLDYIINNKEWIFSGAGVTLVLLLGALFKKRSKKVTNETGIFDSHPPISQPLVSVYTLVPNFLLKWRFREYRLNALIKIDIRSRGEAIRLNLGELPDCRIWLLLINHSPFDLDVESIKGELNYNGCRISVESKDHIDVSKHSSNDAILLEGTLTGDQAIHCSKENTKTYTSLTLRSRIKTSFGVFKKHSGELQCMNVEILNKRELK